MNFNMREHSSILLNYKRGAFIFLSILPLIFTSFFESPYDYDIPVTTRPPIGGSYDSYSDPTCIIFNVKSFSDFDFPIKYPACDPAVLVGEAEAVASDSLLFRSTTRGDCSPSSEEIALKS